MSTQKYTLGKTSLSKLEGVHPSLVKVIKLAIQKTTQDFSVNEGLRSLDRQKRLVAAGASRTLNSKHLKQADGYGHASDLIPWGDFDGNEQMKFLGHGNISIRSPKPCAPLLKN